MKALQKKIIAAVSVGSLLMTGGCTTKDEDQSSSAVRNTEENAVWQEKETEARADSAFERAGSDLVFWYSDSSYEGFFESAAEEYFAETGVKVSVKYQETLDYMGDIYDKTMQDAEFPDVYLISGENLEEAYLYGLASVNMEKEVYTQAATNAQKAAVYQDQMLGYPLSYNTCLFVYQNGYFDTEPTSIQDIIEYSNENEPEENVEYILEWDVNDPFYDFPFVSNSVSFEKTEAESMNIVYDEELYNKDLTFLETILSFFSVDAQTVSEESIIENFLAGRTVCAIIDSDSVSRLEGYSYSLTGLPDLSEELTASSAAVTDMLLVNDFSEKTKQASDFAKYVTVDCSGILRDMTGHFSVIPSENPEWTESVAYQSYESAVLVPNSMNAKDFWVGLKETISKYF